MPERSRYSSRTVYRIRRRRALVLSVLAVVAICVASVDAAQLLAGRLALGAHGGFANGAHGVLPPAQKRAHGSALAWPLQGQAALQLGNGTLAAGPDQRPAPIASLAKVMTAYLTLRRFPLRGGSTGFTVTVTPADARTEATDISEGQSNVAVQPGEQLTERQLLQGLLIPSGNNFADILASEVAGSETAFVARMNATARALGMHHTRYTDPSGFDAGTVSTAADQLRIFRRAIRIPVFRQITSMASVTLPVAGTLDNFNPLVTEGYAGKTGSDGPAGGCLSFVTHVTVAGRRTTAVGVVMGQGQGGSTTAVLAAAGQAAQRLVASATTGAAGAGGLARPMRADGGRRRLPPPALLQSGIDSTQTNPGEA